MRGFMLALTIAALSSCALFGEAPPNPDGSITTELPGGGSVTVIPGPMPMEPITTELPGGGSVIVTPGPPPTTSGGVAGNILGGILGTLTGNPLLGTLAAGGISALLGKLLA